MATGARFRGSLRCAAIFAAAAAAVLLVSRGGHVLSAVGATAGSGEPAGRVGPAAVAPQIPAKYSAALRRAWHQVDALSRAVARRGLLPRFGRRAEAVVRRAVRASGATGEEAAGLEQVLDASLKVLFQQQLQVLLARAVDFYDAQMAVRPNPLEASLAAEKFFDKGVARLERPGHAWSAEAERKDLLAQMDQKYSSDWGLVTARAKQGQGKQVTIEVIRKLQQQAAVVQREAETRGAFPWNVKWQYFLEKSPVGFRGQYSQGRSIVELLLMPSPDPRYKKNLLNRIGPLNLAVAFDMLM